MFCTVCGAPVMTVFSAKKGWAQACIKCGELTVLPDQMQNTEKKSAENAMRGMNFYLSQGYEKAEYHFSLAAAQSPDEPQYLWAMLLARYGVRFCRVLLNHGTSIGFIINFWRADFPSQPLRQTEEYQLIEDEAAGIDIDLLKYYTNEAENIDKGLKQIGEIDEQYDVFLSYKYSDEDNDDEQTPEARLASLIYPALREKNVRTFYAPKSMAGKNVYDYEGYIHNAIKRANMMVVLASDGKNVSSPWVESEWKRFLTFNKDEQQRLLICAVGGLLPTSMPPELSHYQMDLHAKNVSIEAANWFASEIASRLKELGPKPILTPVNPPKAPVTVPPSVVSPPETKKNDAQEKQQLEAAQKKVIIAQLAGQIRQIAEKKAAQEKTNRTQSKNSPQTEWVIDGLRYKKKADGTLMLIRCEDKSLRDLTLSVIDGRPVTTIGREAFQGMRMLTTIFLNEVEQIESRAFYGCRNLRVVVFSDRLTEIQTAAFAGCGELKGIHIPANVKIIGSEAFSRCRKLEKIHLPDGLQALGHMAFFDCEKLYSINHPAMLPAIDPYVFSGCASLPDAVYRAFTGRTAGSAPVNTVTSPIQTPKSALAQTTNQQKKNGKPDKPKGMFGFLSDLFS